MALYHEDIVDIELSSGSIHRSWLNHSIGLGDAAANRFGVRLFRDGAPVTIGTASCQGYFHNSQGQNIALTSNGTIEDNVAYVTLPQACYNYEGQFTLAIKIVGGGVTGTMRIIDGMVDNTNTSSAVAPTSSVPSYQEVLATYAEMEEALADAENWVTNFAPAFAAGTANTAGSYVTNDGKMYLLPAGHEADATWANTSKTQVNVGGELSDLKSAIERIVGKTVYQLEWITGGINSTTGEVDTSMTTRICTSDYIIIESGYIICNLSPDVRVSIARYDSSGNFISPLISFSSDIIFYLSDLPSETAKIKLQARRSDNAYLTDDKKAALINAIFMAEGKGITSGLVPFDRSVSLTDAQKTCARGNIDAPSVEYVDNAIETSIEESLSTITEINENNLWLWGNQDIAAGTHKAIYDVNIPAGTYKFSAEIEKATTTNCRIIFYKSPVKDDNVLLNTNMSSDGKRHSIDVALEEKADIIVMYAAMNDQAASTGAAWKNIQLESGSQATDYDPYKTAIDYKARYSIENYGYKYPTRNLWTYGDQTFTRYTDVAVDIPAGEYVLSANIVSRKNGEEASNYTSRVEITTKNDGVIDPVTITRNHRGGTLVSLPSAATSIRLFASNTSSNSVDTICTWSNIQLESGSFMTPYIQPYLPCPEGVIIKSDTLMEVENVEIAERQWRFITVRDGINPSNLMIEIDAKWIGTEVDEYHVPEVRFFYSSGNLGTGYYNIGGKGVWKRQQFRMPPFVNYTNNYKNLFTVEIQVPTGLTLTIRKLVVRYDNTVNRKSTGLIIHTHGSFQDYPQHSLPALTAAAGIGATHFITIPKVSSDDVWFAYHDDTLDLTLDGNGKPKTILRTSAGEIIPSNTVIPGTSTEANGKAFKDLPWEEFLETFDSGVYRAPDWAGLRLMKISDMLEVCAKTGIHPVFSWHPWANQATTQKFRDLLETYDMVGKTTIIPSNAFFTDSAWAVFGNDIEMYKFGPEAGQASTTTIGSIITLINGTSGLDKSKCCIALWASDATDALIEMILGAGIRAGLHQNTNTSPSGRANDSFSEGAYHYWMQRGVTIFMDNHNSSVGLNW